MAKQKSRMPGLEDGEILGLRVQQPGDLAGGPFQAEASRHQAVKVRVPDAVVVIGVDGDHAFLGKLLLQTGAGPGCLDRGRGQLFAAGEIEGVDEVHQQQHCSVRRQPGGPQAAGRNWNGHDRLLGVRRRLGAVNPGQMRQDQSYKSGPTCPTYRLR